MDISVRAAEYIICIVLLTMTLCSILVATVPSLHFIANHGKRNNNNNININNNNNSNNINSDKNIDNSNNNINNNNITLICLGSRSVIIIFK